MKLVILVGSILCLHVFPSAVFAQSASVSGDIRGTITDPSGAVLTKATVTALDPQTGLHRAAVSEIAFWNSCFRIIPAADGRLSNPQFFGKYFGKHSATM